MKHKDLHELPEVVIHSTNVNSWQANVFLNFATSSSAQWTTAAIPCEVSIYSLHLKIIEQDVNKLSVYDLV